MTGEGNLNSSTSRPESYRLFAQRVSLVAITNGLMSLRNILLIPIISKELGADYFGIWVQLIVFVTLASNISTLGLRNAINRFLSGMESKSEIRNGYYSMLIFSILISICVTVVAWISLFILADAFEPETFEVISLSLWMIPIASLDMLALSFMIARRRIRMYSFFAILRAFGQVALVYIFVHNGMGLLGAIKGTLLIDAIVGAIMILSITRSIGLAFPNFTGIKDYLTYSIPTVPLLLSTWIVTSSDRYIISFFKDHASVGAYSVAYGVGDFVYFFLSPVGLVLNPTIFSLWQQGQGTRAREFMRRALKLFLLFAVPASIGASFLAQPIILLLSTPEMANQGYLIVPLVASSMVVFGIAGILGQVFALHKDTKRIGFIWIVAAVSNITANFILVPIMGIIGAAVATLASYLEALFLILILGRRYSSDFPGFPWVFAAKSIFSSLGMICSVYLIQSQVDDSLLVNLVILILSGAAAYFILIRVIRALDVEEIEFVKKLLFGKT